MFDQTIKNINRIRQIIQILIKYGFEDFVSNTQLKYLVKRSSRINWMRQDRPIYEFSRWERARMVLEELGPTFIKFGQVLSNRPDILPIPFIAELEKLQNEVPAFPFTQAKAILERELGAGLSDIFEIFLEKPIGSASIGQVYHGRLKNGEEVVVKVRRPGVTQVIETDISILKEIVSYTEAYLENKGIINIMDIVLAFERSMQREINYINEAKNIEQFRNFYRHHKKFYVPRAYRNLSTERILVIEYANGCKITDVERLRSWGYNPEKIAQTGLEIYLTQIFEFGFFHADPHPGNIIIREDGTICLIDFGMVGKLIKRDKFAFAGVFIGMAQQNPRKMADNLSKLAIKHEINDRRAFEYDLSELIEDFSSLDVEEGSMAEAGVRLQEIIYKYRMKVPGSIFLILRALAILEGIGKTLYPKMNAFDMIKPFGIKILQEQYSIDNVSEEIAHRITQFDHFFRNFPFYANDILKSIKEGKLEMQVNNTGYEELERKVDLAGDKLTLALVIFGLLLASSIIMTAQLHPNHYTRGGVPYLSIIGFTIAAVLGFALFVKYLRNRP